MTGFSSMLHGERPRERLFSKGAESLTLAELLAILLRTGTKDQDVMQLSAALLQEWGGLRGLALASPAEILGIKGIKEAKAASLVAALEIGKRLSLEEISQNDSWEKRLKAKALSLKNEQRELIVCFYLTSKEQVLAEEHISFGGVDGAYMDLPYLFRRALRLDATSLIMMHNHPDGTAEASEEDKKITQYVAKCAELLGLRLKGHYVLAGGNFYPI